ncbi:MAG: aspartate kinase [Clostridia bacterium]
MSLKVVKFGGSSLADANQFIKVKNIINAERESRRYVVPSAPGKRFSEDKKITDLLYSCYECKLPDEFEKSFSIITERFNSIIAELHLDLNLDEEFMKIKNSFILKAGRDYAASRGEYINGLILAKYLNFTFIDAAEIIYFQDNGTFDAERTNDAIKNVLLHYDNAVIPGFYGSMPNDTIKTFSRGGSDITGSIIARAVSADIYENFTDVSGFMVIDPRIVKNPARIDVITYKELRELSYMGATVLHEEAIFPVRKASIPINIKNTNEPNEKGTFIVESAETSSGGIITGIAGKKGFSVITIEKAMMNQELGFVRKILSILESNNLSFEHLPSGIDTLSVILPTNSIENIKAQIISDIYKGVNPDNVDIDSDLALVAIVGRNMKSNKGTAARVFSAVAQAGINIRMIDQGSSELNIIIGVDECDFEKAVNNIYHEFIK